MGREKIASNEFYEIEIDKDRNRIYLTVQGYWKSLMEVRSYLRDIRTAVAGLSAGFTIVTDLTQARTPSEETSELHIKAQAYLINAGLARTAEIHPESTVTRMALNRYAQTSGMSKGVFSTLEEAEAWLEKNPA